MAETSFLTKETIRLRLADSEEKPYIAIPRKRVIDAVQRALDDGEGVPEEILTSDDPDVLRWALLNVDLPSRDVHAIVERAALVCKDVSDRFPIEHIASEHPSCHEETQNWLKSHAVSYDTWKNAQRLPVRPTRGRPQPKTVPAAPAPELEVVEPSPAAAAVATPAPAGLDAQKPVDLFGLEEEAKRQAAFANRQPDPRLLAEIAATQAKATAPVAAETPVPAAEAEPAREPVATPVAAEAPQARADVPADVPAVPETAPSVPEAAIRQAAPATAETPATGPETEPSRDNVADPVSHTDVPTATEPTPLPPACVPAAAQTADTTPLAPEPQAAVTTPSTKPSLPATGAPAAEVPQAQTETPAPGENTPAAETDAYQAADSAPVSPEYDTERLTALHDQAPNDVTRTDYARALLERRETASHPQGGAPTHSAPSDALEPVIKPAAAPAKPAYDPSEEMRNLAASLLRPGPRNLQEFMKARFQLKKNPLVMSALCARPDLTKGECLSLAGEWDLAAQAQAVLLRHPNLTPGSARLVPWCALIAKIKEPEAEGRGAPTAAEMEDAFREATAPLPDAAGEPDGFLEQRERVRKELLYTLAACPEATDELRENAAEATPGEAGPLQSHLIQNKFHRCPGLFDALAAREELTANQAVAVASYEACTAAQRLRMVGRDPGLVAAVAECSPFFEEFTAALCSADADEELIYKLVNAVGTEDKIRRRLVKVAEKFPLTETAARAMAQDGQVPHAALVALMRRAQAPAGAEGGTEFSSEVWDQAEMNLRDRGLIGAVQAPTENRPDGTKEDLPDGKGDYTINLNEILEHESARIYKRGKTGQGVNREIRAAVNDGANG